MFGPNRPPDLYLDKCSMCWIEWDKYCIIWGDLLLSRGGEQDRIGWAVISPPDGITPDLLSGGNAFLCDVFLCNLLLCNVFLWNVLLCNVFVWNIFAVQCVYLSLIVTRSISYQVAMPSLWNGQSADDIEYYRARDDTSLDTLSDDGMPCEMDNQPGPWDSISRGAAEDSEYYCTR